MAGTVALTLMLEQGYGHYARPSGSPDRVIAYLHGDGYRHLRGWDDDCEGGDQDETASEPADFGD